MISCNNLLYHSNDRRTEPQETGFSAVALSLPGKERSQDRNLPAASPFQQTMWSPVFFFATVYRLMANRCNKTLSSFGVTTVLANNLQDAEQCYQLVSLGSKLIHFTHYCCFLQYGNRSNTQLKFKPGKVKHHSFILILVIVPPYICIYL